jgi:hypothetical protein
LEGPLIRNKDRDDLDEMMDAALEENKHRQEFGAITVKRVIRFHFLTSIESDIGSNRNEYNNILETYEEMKRRCDDKNEDPLTTFFNKITKSIVDLEAENEEIDKMIKKDRLEISLTGNLLTKARLKIFARQRLTTEEKWLELVETLMRKYDKRRDPIHIEEAMIVLAEYTQHRLMRNNGTYLFNLSQRMHNYYQKTLKCGFKYETQLFYLIYARYFRHQFKSIRWIDEINNNDWLYAAFLFHLLRTQRVMLFHTKLPIHQWKSGNPLIYLLRTMDTNNTNLAAVSSSEIHRIANVIHRIRVNLRLCNNLIDETLIQLHCPYVDGVSFDGDLLRALMQ